MELYEVHTIHPTKDSVRETDIREAVRKFLNDGTNKWALRINIEGVVFHIEPDMSVIIRCSK
jgi:hypothetical protein